MEVAAGVATPPWSVRVLAASLTLNVSLSLASRGGEADDEMLDRLLVLSTGALSCLADAVRAAGDGAPPPDDALRTALALRMAAAVGRAVMVVASILCAWRGSGEVGGTRLRATASLARATCSSGTRRPLAARSGCDFGALRWKIRTAQDLLTRPPKKLPNRLNLRLRIPFRATRLDSIGRIAKPSPNRQNTSISLVVKC